MTKNIKYKSYNELCCFTNEVQQIDIKYVEIRSIGMNGYKKIDFDCDNEGCINLKSIQCPVYSSAPAETD